MKEIKTDDGPPYKLTVYGGEPDAEIKDLLQRTADHFGMRLEVVEHDIEGCDACQLLFCVCHILAAHQEGCDYRLAMTCAVGIPCDDHKNDECSICYPCTCKTKETDDTAA